MGNFCRLSVINIDPTESITYNDSRRDKKYSIYQSNEYEISQYEVWLNSAHVIRVQDVEPSWKEVVNVGVNSRIMLINGTGYYSPLYAYQIVEILEGRDLK